MFKNIVVCSPETITTLLTGYTPMQNVFGVKKIFLIKLKKNFHNSCDQCVITLDHHFILAILIQQ